MVFPVSRRMATEPMIAPADAAAFREAIAPQPLSVSVRSLHSERGGIAERFPVLTAATTEHQNGDLKENPVVNLRVAPGCCSAG
jgi:hypothetical protein